MLSDLKWWCNIISDSLCFGSSIVSALLLLSSSSTNSNWLSSSFFKSSFLFSFVIRLGSISFLNSWRKSNGVKFNIDGLCSSSIISFFSSFFCSSSLSSIIGILTLGTSTVSFLSIFSSILLSFKFSSFLSLLSSSTSQKSSSFKSSSSFLVVSSLLLIFIFTMLLSSFGWLFTIASVVGFGISSILNALIKSSIETTFFSSTWGWEGKISLLASSFLIIWGFGLDSIGANTLNSIPNNEALLFSFISFVGVIISGIGWLFVVGCSLLSSSIDTKSSLSSSSFFSLTSWGWVNAFCCSIWFVEAFTSGWGRSPNKLNKSSKFFLGFASSNFFWCSSSIFFFSSSSCFFFSSSAFFFSSTMLVTEYSFINVFTKFISAWCMLSFGFISFSASSSIDTKSSSSSFTFLFPFTGNALLLFVKSRVPNKLFILFVTIGSFLGGM